VLVPIWLTRAEIAALERHHGIRLLPEGAPADQTIIGHIDFLQVRNGAVHILDYKPRPHQPTVRAAHHLCPRAHPARGLRLFDIKCAWFNEDHYCGILPAHGARPYELKPGIRRPKGGCPSPRPIST
jgi:hypothetical protein